MVGGYAVNREELKKELESLLEEYDYYDYKDLPQRLQHLFDQYSNSKTKELLNDYSDWLHEYGYIDADYYVEKPTAVDRYLEELEQSKESDE